MRIAIVTTQGVTSLFRSWPEYLLARALADRGHKVTAYTYYDPSSPVLSQREEHMDGITVRRVSFNRLWISWELKSWIERDPVPDLVHIHHLRNALAYWSARWFRSKGAAVVHSPLGMLHDPYLVADRDDPLSSPLRTHGVFFHVKDALKAAVVKGRVLRSLYNYYIHAALLLAHRLVVCTAHDGKILASLGLPREKIRQVPHWVSTSLRGKEYPISEGWSRPVILYIGQLKRRKGFDVLVEAMPYILSVYPMATFVFVSHYGSGGRELEAMASRLGTLSHLRVLGPVSEDVKVSLMRTADVFVLPTRYEGFGLPLLEAMVEGCPVVSSDVPAVNELVKHGWNGVLVPPNDAMALAAAVDKLLVDNHLREQLVANGRRWVEQNFSEEVVLPKLLTVYEEALAARQAG